MPPQTSKIVVGEVHSNYTRNHNQPLESDFGFLESVVGSVVSRAAALVEILDAPHAHGGNPGYPAEAMLAALVMQFVLNERYANGFLNRLGSDDRLLGICGLDRAPSEGAYSQFKRHKLAHHKGLIRSIIAEVFLECGVEIERLRALGLVPADKPPLGHSLVMDSTDVVAWARPGRTSRKTGEEIPSKDQDAAWGYRTAKNSRSSKLDSGKRRSSKVKKADTASSGKEPGDEDSKGGTTWATRSTSSRTPTMDCPCSPGPVLPTPVT